MLKDAFKVSLSILLTLGGLIEFVISLFMPSYFSDNWGVIVIITLLALQGLLLLLANTVSTKSDKENGNSYMSQLRWREQYHQ